MRIKASAARREDLPLALRRRVEGLWDGGHALKYVRPSEVPGEVWRLRDWLSERAREFGSPDSSHGSVIGRRLNAVAWRLTRWMLYETDYDLEGGGA